MDPYLGEVRMFAGMFAPRGWAFCDGQLLPIAQNTALFSLLGTAYGGNGQTTIGLPDLRDRSPVGAGQGPGMDPIALGERLGSPSVTLLLSEMPSHNHTMPAVDAAGTRDNPSAAVWAQSRRGRARERLYAPAGSPAAAMAPDVIVPNGGGQPHENRPPYLKVAFIIALQGLFPSRT